MRDWLGNAQSPREYRFWGWAWTFLAFATLIWGKSPDWWIFPFILGQIKFGFADVIATRPTQPNGACDE